MCGIAVAIAWDGAETIVRQLLEGLAHRGDVTDPVATPFRNVAMGTRRLRVVDGARAVQPRLSHDGRFLVAFNGEIFNHAALRRDLEAEGVGFKTESDTEVLACALSHWGIAALDRLNGMYAFVALDLRDGDFLAARDPFGVKPLYFTLSAPGVLFCSEIRPLLAAVPVGDVLFLPPGTLMTKTRCARFTPRADARRGKTLIVSTETLDAAIEAAVRRRLPLDLPFALMVSGGIDSTLVAHYARRMAPEAPGYFLGTPGAPDYAYAAAYADASGLDLRHVELENDAAATACRITEVVRTVEAFEPDTVRNSVCTYALARRIHADGFRVALSGEGADELFAGYVPLEHAFAAGDASGAFVRAQHIDAMHRTCLQRVDRCGMRFQLEVREPFLDRDVAALALTLDAAALVEDVAGMPRGKAPLRAVYDLHGAELPSAIRDRRKVPLNEGSGFDAARNVSPWIDHAESTVSDAVFRDGRKRFAAFHLRTKEEFLYLDTLARSLDVFRVPHLADRTHLRVPYADKMSALRDYVVSD
jgi:asparagine synthase (glutamine-hydrolysing)